MTTRGLRRVVAPLSAAALLCGARPAAAQQCEVRASMPAEQAARLDAAARLVFDQAKRGDVEAIRANASAGLKERFEAVAGAVREGKDALAKASYSPKALYVLSAKANGDAEGRITCGAKGKDFEAEFFLPGLPEGKHAIAIADLSTLSMTALFQNDAGWRLSGLYLRPRSARGHDAEWFLKKARAYAGAKKSLSAWFYFVIAWDLSAPVPFMDSKELTRIATEASKTRPADLPAPGKPVAMTANGVRFKVVEMTATRAKDGLYWVVRYLVPSVDALPAILADSRALADELLRRHPDASDAFDVLAIHAIDGKGGDVSLPIPLKGAASR
ncbi:MAG: hypothetical protein HY078_17505 [Elusimicrobia bacterium]|nr:hypothetical protein [Elusimicrobiota bacterium]